ncbi:MAG TPA: hypothetical protein VJS45_15295 [Acidimicrobiia bacterium]|jgi:hypothetical protein|nr:hypothetical protein [Acidimicrobiia bacterium]
MDTQSDEGLSEKVGEEVSKAQEGGKEMCCDGKQTAEEHRHNSPDGKCCIDD